MIDYLSLALGHGLLAIAFLRLVMRDALDVDPRIEEYSNKAEAERAASLVQGRASRLHGKKAPPEIQPSADASGDARRDVLGDQNP